MMALAFADKKKHKAIKLITYSQYIADGLRENLTYCKETEFQTFRGKDLEHQTE